MLEINSTKFDSEEEKQVAYWLNEADEAGLVSNVFYHIREYELSQRVTDGNGRFLLHPHKYTPDFSFILETPLKVFQQFFKYQRDIVIDVKGSFSKYHDQKSFSINQKWVYAKYGVYVQKVIPEKLFKKTFVPEICRYTPTRKWFVKKYVGCKVISDFVR
jgi:hypothetical protein